MADNGDTDYFTKNVDRTWRLFENLEAGMIGMNTGNVRPDFYSSYVDAALCADQTPSVELRGRDTFRRNQGIWLWQGVRQRCRHRRVHGMCLIWSVVVKHTDRPCTDYQDRNSHLVGPLLRMRQFGGGKDMHEEICWTKLYGVAIGVAAIISSHCISFHACVISLRAYPSNLNRAVAHALNVF